MNKIKIYSINYLQNSDFSEEDLHNIFDTKSLKYSLLTYMIKLACPTISDDKLHKALISNKYWQEYNFTTKQFEQAINDIALAYKNIYLYTDIKCKQLAEGYVIFNGLKVKNNNFLIS